MIPDTMILSLSGGLDSTVLLAHAISVGFHVGVVNFSYGSKHNRWENDAACKVADHYKVPFHFVNLDVAMAGFKSDLLKSGGPIPEGHYEAESMKNTVVPCRNMIFASLLAGLAESRGACQVWLGVHAGDHAIYPDCRPEFVTAMSRAVDYATDGKINLIAPFLRLTKKDIVAHGLNFKAPLHLTRTCYKNQPVACGKCGSCQERLEAFKINGVEDPIEYESREILPKGK
jgi:7-cyano-7-deazaguanine synthase